MNWNKSYSSPASDNREQIVLSLDEWRQQSHAMSPWKTRISKRLQVLEDGEEYNEQSNITALSLLHAKEFLECLPLDIDAPHISANADGGILFEWYKKEREREPTIFSAVVSNDGIIFSVLQYGVPSTHGALNFSSESLNIIISIVKSHFGVLPYASRFVS